ncbi:MAG: hypothetical protein KAS73_07860 [Candidatus Sabulitectum sp.]|nr:hypothetical protein [Candidatus Sabulitectum sp.]
MKKFYLLMALVALPALFFACGNGEAPVADADARDEVEEVEIEVVIINDLEDWDIAEIWVDPSDGAWTDNLIDELIAPGDEFTVILEEAGSYDIWITDEDGDTYTRYNIEIDAHGYEWAVTIEDGDWQTSEEEVTITINNELGSWTLWYCYCSTSDDDSWGEDRFGSEIVDAGESFTFEVMSGDYYDIKVIDDEDDEYIIWDVWVGEDGYVWDVALSDMDNSERDDTPEAGAPITIYNGLGDWTIWYVYGDPSDGPWGEDRLGTDLLSPGDELTFYVPAGDTYDFKVEDEDGDIYTIWGVDVDEDGFYWEVELSDMD